MRILALETSSSAGSVAALDGERVMCETILPTGRRSAQLLAPALLQTLKDAGWRPGDVELVAVTQGPGSFTGLRVGATTAKTFAYATGAELLGVNTLEVIAAQALDDEAEPGFNDPRVNDPCFNNEVWILMDAFRGQLFVARYRARHGALPVEIAATHIAEVDQWLSEYAARQWVSGPGVARVAARLPQDAAIVASEFASPRAATVGRIAWMRYQAGERNDVWSFAPRYFRPSAAEERHAF